MNETKTPALKRLALDYIQENPKLQSRELKPALVKQYVEAMRRGEEFPPIKVVRDGRDHYFLVDGHHRIAATRELNGIYDIAAEIIDGTFTDALWLSWGANRNHGLKRTQKEKRRAIQAALEHPKWGKKAAREIARHIGCDHKTVATIRRRMGGEIPTRKTHSASGPQTGPSKESILRACTLVSRVKPEQERLFNPEELKILRTGHEALNRLLFGARTLRPGLLKKQKTQKRRNA